MYVTIRLVKDENPVEPNVWRFAMIRDGDSKDEYSKAFEKPVHTAAAIAAVYGNLKKVGYRALECRELPKLQPDGGVRFLMTLANED